MCDCKIEFMLLACLLFYNLFFCFRNRETSLWQHDCRAVTLVLFSITFHFKIEIRKCFLKAATRLIIGWGDGARLKLVSISSIRQKLRAISLTTCLWQSFCKQKKPPEDCGSSYKFEMNFPFPLLASTSPRSNWINFNLIIFPLPFCRYFLLEISLINIQWIKPWFCCCFYEKKNQHGKELTANCR